MKRMKKLASLLLAMVMVLSMTVAAFAEEGTKPYSITVNAQSDRVSLAGNTYNAYKLFNVTYDGKNAYAYTVADEFKDYSYDGKSGKDLVDYVQTLTEASSINAFAEDIFKFISAPNRNIDPSGSVTVPEDNTVVNKVIIGLDEMGYYLVSGTVTASKEGEGEEAKVERVIAACSLDTVTDTNKDITIKADAPTLEKKIIENNQSVDANNASVGDVVTYQIKSVVPNMTGYDKYYFIVHDILSKGLDYKSDSIVIKIGTEELNKDIDYTVTSEKDETTGETKIKIVFNKFIEHKNKIGQDVIITYMATINHDAVIGNSGNVNTAFLEYSNNPNITPNGENEPGKGEDNVTGETPEDKVVTYITQIDLTKVIKDTDEILSGAEFTIKGTKVNQVYITGDNYVEDPNGEYFKLIDGSYTTTAATENTEYKYAKDSSGNVIKARKEAETGRWETVAEENVSQNGIVGKDGKLSFIGLGAGEYIITEVKAPEGYNKLDAPIKLTIKMDNISEIVTGEEEASWKYSVDGNTDIAADTNGHIQYKVENSAGALLPSTGGIGTTIFYAVGIILMAGAVFFVVRKKRA